MQLRRFSHLQVLCFKSEGILKRTSMLHCHSSEIGFNISFHPMVQRPLVGQDVLIIEASRSHSDTPQSVGLLWTSDQVGAEHSTLRHIALTTDRHPCPRQNSNPQSQETRGRTPKPQTAQPLGSAGISQHSKENQSQILFPLELSRKSSIFRDYRFSFF